MAGPLREGDVRIAGCAGTWAPGDPIRAVDAWEAALGEALVALMYETHPDGAAPRWEAVTDACPAVALEFWLRHVLLAAPPPERHPVTGRPLSGGLRLWQTVRPPDAPALLRRILRRPDFRPSAALVRDLLAGPDRALRLETLAALAPRSAPPPRGP